MARIVIWMKQMIFTKEVEEAIVEVTHKIEDGVDEEVPDGDDEPWSEVTTRSGRYVRAPSHPIAEVGASAIGFTKAEEN
jgi:hypothetical protein